MSNKNMWWGYKHVNGSIQVKRYFYVKDLEDAKESDFVSQVFEPFPANNRTEAIQHIYKLNEESIK